MAKAFEFRLEKVLDVRRAKEELARRDLAAARQAVIERNRLLLALLNQEDEAVQELRALRQSALDPVRLRRADEFRASLERMIQRERGILQELVKGELEKRRRAGEARKEVRVLERFRERQLRLHRQEMEREERKYLDEIGQRLAKGA